MKNKYKQISSEILHSNPYWDYKFDKYVLPGGNEGGYHYVETPGSVMVIPVMHNERIVVVKQFRYLNSRFSLEFPGGGMKKGLSATENAVIELREEAGFYADKMIFLGIFNPFNGVTNEICNVYLAKYLNQVQAAPEESEEFEIMNMSVRDVNDAIVNGEIWDGMTLAAWSIFLSSNYYTG